MIIAASITALAAAGLALLMGWHRRAQPWRQATGWDRIPAQDQPGDAVARLLAEQGIRIGWLGHSGFVVEWGGHVVLFDPNTSRTCCGVAPRLLEPAGDVARLPAIDAVCLSHAHYDHMDAATLRALPAVRRLVIPEGCAGYVRDVQPGAERVSLRADGNVVIGDLVIRAVPAAHNGNRFHPWKSRQPALGYVLTRGGFSLYFAGDTSARNPFTRIRDAYHPAIALLPIGAYEPARPLQRYHMNPEEAVAAARDLGVRGVVPCHFSTFRLSFEDPCEPLPRFARAAKAAGLEWMMPVLWRGAP